MFSDDGYRALHAAAGLVQPVDRSVIRVGGADRATWLQGLLTNDIAALGPGTGCYAAWLTPQGRMITDMHVLETGEALWLDVPAALAAALAARLDGMVFAEDVSVADLGGSLAAIGVHGPTAAPVFAAACGGVITAAELQAWQAYQHAEIALEGGPVRVVHLAAYGVPGYVVYADPGRLATLVARLSAAGAVTVPEETAEVARIEAGRPRFLVDMDEHTIPLEAGIEHEAISFTKGCYVGQEVVIRVMHRGGGRVAKKLVGLAFAGTAVPKAGAVVRAGGRDVGALTSAALSPRLGRAVALAYVHRDFTEPGTAVEVAAGDAPLAAVVHRTPFMGT
ncbi:MAG: glycine cleavage T C-terminal barrel domain-containing protein [Vicinamibacterales bacterium]|nr:glycine cleavage T C-terminal barrel domain-containing protein [Vicinamibacterales bacterium]